MSALIQLYQVAEKLILSPKATTDTRCGTTLNSPAGCAKRPSSKAAASTGANRTLAAR